MKKVRFFSVAVAVVAVLFVSAWATSVTYGLTTLNGFAPGETSLKCFTLNGAGNLTNVSVTGKLSSACTPANGWIRLYQLNGAQQTLIGSTSVPINQNFSNVQVPSPFPQNTYPAKGSYCISGYVTTSSTGLCGITLTGSVTFSY